MHDILKPGIALLVIAAIAAAILGGVNYITAQPIAEAELNTTKESVMAVLPEVDKVSEEDIKTVDEGDVASYIIGKDANGNVIGYAVSITTNGFSAGLKLMYGIDMEGKITGLSVLDCSNETPGLGANVSTNDAFREQFVGKEGGSLKVNKDGGEIDALTGATITSRAVANAANTATEFFNNNLKGGAN